MKKNIIIIVLAALVVMLGLYAFAQKVKSDQYAEEAIKQQGIAEEVKAQAVAAQIEAERQRYFVEELRVMADSLHQQLDNCK